MLAARMTARRIDATVLIRGLFERRRVLCRGSSPNPSGGGISSYDTSIAGDGAGRCR